MRYLLIFFLSFLSTLLLANNSEKYFHIGDRALELKEEGKARDIHPSVSKIRKLHPHFLYHKRDKTLREGVRTKRGSLKACVNCHSSTDQHGEYIPIDQKNQFCSTCHQKVGTSIDCFSCHRSTPKEDL